MRNCKTIFSILVLIFLSATSLKAQISAEQHVFCVAGMESLSSENILFTSTIGQPFFTTLSGSNSGFTQGFQQPGYLNCPGDYDNNGVINVTDLLIFNTTFSTSNLNTDMNGDGFVGVTDLIIFITLIGTSCSN
jgi:hypothetical protein